MPKPQPRRPPTRIGEGLTIEGTIHGSDDLAIAGRIEGMIDLMGRVDVEPEGRINGEICADRVQVSGHVDGEIVARERFEITATGLVTGDVEATRIIFALGARFDGMVRTRRPKRSSSTGAPSAAKAQQGKAKPSSPKPAAPSAPQPSTPAPEPKPDVATPAAAAPEKVEASGKSNGSEPEPIPAKAAASDRSE